MMLAHLICSALVSLTGFAALPRPGWGCLLLLVVAVFCAELLNTCWLNVSA